MTPVDMMSVSNDDEEWGEEGVDRAGHCPLIGEALTTCDGICAATVDKEGTRVAANSFEYGFGDGNGGRLECVAGEARCSQHRMRCREVGEDGSILFDAAVYAAKEVAAWEEVTGDWFVEVHLGRASFGSVLRTDSA